MANINIVCPHCQTTLETPDSLIGNAVQCPSCGKTFVVQAPPPPPGQPFVAPQVATPAPHRPIISRQPSGSSFLSKCMIALALAISIAALCLTLLKPSMPELELKKDPEKAVRAQLKFNKEIQSIGSYFWRKNGDKILKSLDVKEVKTNGDWAVAFYKLSLGATEEKHVMWLHKVSDGYWIEASSSSKCPKEWREDMERKRYEFTKDSGHFDESDI